MSLGEDQCPKSLWQHFKNDQDGDGRSLELQVYLSLLNNVLKISHNVVVLLEGEDGTIYELYEIIFTLKTKLLLWNRDQCSSLISPWSVQASVLSLLPWACQLGTKLQHCLAIHSAEIISLMHLK